MPELKWIGKDKVINYDCEVPFHLLKEREELSVNSNNTENLLIKGDNLLTLKSLLPYYYNKIKCIYIDPPYNTGNEKWIYNDNVNSPEMKKWIGNIVGSEGEDLCRHDKWLCMMYPRLKLLEELLAEDGIIFVSIDDNEQHYLRIILDEIFDYNNIIGIFTVKTPNQTSDKNKTKNTDFLLCYGKTKKSKFNLPHKYQYARCTTGKENQTQPIITFPPGIEVKNVNDGIYYETRKTGGNENIKIIEGRFFIENGKLKEPIKLEARWSNPNDIRKYISKIKSGSKEKIYNKFGKELIDLYFLSDRFQPQMVKIGFELPYSIIDNYTSKGGDLLKKILGEAHFPYPKHTDFIKFLIRISTKNNNNAIVLDSFAGTGTTAHSVLELNKEDGGNRKFILVELEDEIANKVTAERLKRVIKGYSYNSNHIGGLGGGFKFMELDKPLFNKYKKLIGEPSYEELGSYIYFTETYQPINWKKFNKDDWYLGENKSTHYFLIYETKEQNELGENFFEVAQKYKGNKIVYSDVLMLDDEILNKYNIVFKQIPYEIKTF